MKNILKEKLRRGEVVIGTIVGLGHPDVTVDACFVGPFDLSLNMGLPVPPRYDNPQLIEALDRILEAAKKTGKTPGIGSSVERIRWAIEKGFRFNTVGEVDGLLFEAAQNALNTARGI